MIYFILSQQNKKWDQAALYAIEFHVCPDGLIQVLLAASVLTHCLGEGLQTDKCQCKSNVMKCTQVHGVFTR